MLSITGYALYESTRHNFSQMQSLPYLITSVRSILHGVAPLSSCPGGFQQVHACLQLLLPQGGLDVFLRLCCVRLKRSRPTKGTLATAKQQARRIGMAF